MKLQSVLATGRLRQNIVAGQKCIVGIDRLVQALQTDQHCAILGHDARLERLDADADFDLSANLLQFHVTLREYPGRFGAADCTFQAAADVRIDQATTIFLSRFGRSINGHS